MRKLYLLPIYLIALLFFVMPTVSAEKTDWSDNTYNFKTIRSALIYDLDFSQVNLSNDIIARKLADEYIKKSTKPTYITFSAEQLDRKISLEQSIDLDTLKKTDSEKATTLFAENMSHFVDIYVETHLLSYKIGSYIVPAHTTWQNQTTTDHYTDSNGRTRDITHTYTIPVYVPDATVTTAVVRLRFDVFNAKTNKVIFSREEERVRDNSDDPYGVFSRMTDSFFSDLKNKMQ
ncbi:MAG: hypothetical protein WCS30_09850 [Selenomonadaceae bacterium]